MSAKKMKVWEAFQLKKREAKENNSCKRSKRFFVILFLLFVSLYIPKEAQAYPVENIRTVVKVGYSAGCPPFQFIEDGNLQGLHIDILQRIAQVCNYQLAFVPVSGTAEAADKLEKHQIDILLGVTPKETLQGAVEYTDSISDSCIIILTTNLKAEDFLHNSKEKKLVSIEDNTVHHSVVSAINSVGGASFYVCADQEDAFTAFCHGQTDAVIGVKESLLYQLKGEKGGEYTIVNNNVASIHYYIGVAKENRDLLRNINTVIGQLRASGEYDQIAEKWIEDPQLRAELLVQKVKGITIIIGSLAAIFILFEFRLNRLLKKKVDEKTEALQNANDALREKLMEIRENNEIRNKVVDQSPSGIIVMDCQMKVTLINEKAKELIEDKNTDLGQYALRSPLIACIMKDKQKRAGEDGECSGFEVKITKNSYKEYIYRYDCYNLYTENQEKRGEILVVEDVTDEIRLKDEIFAKEKNSLLNQMIAEISHDILNPLTAIKTLTELMPKKKGNEDFYQKLSSIVPKEVDRITALIKRLLDYAKPYQSKREMVDLPEAIQACIHLMAPVMEREGIGFQLKTEKGSRLYTDEGQLKQSMLNLIANGIDAMKERKKKEKDLTPLHADFADSYVLSVTEWKENGMIYIQVKDQGIGMSHSQQEKAVTPFFTTKSTGSGLGLSITKRFVEENGGKLKIESYQGKGTTITLCFIDAMSLSVETSYADRGQMMNDGRRRT